MSSVDAAQKIKPNVDSNKVNLDVKSTKSNQDSKVPPEDVPQIISNKKIADAINTENKNINTAEDAPKEAYKIISIDKKIMLAEHKQKELKENSKKNDNEESVDNCLHEEYVEDDLFIDEPSVNDEDDPLKITPESEKEIPTVNSSVCNTIVNKANQNKQNIEIIKVEKFDSHNISAPSPSVLKVYSYNDIKNESNQKEEYHSYHEQFLTHIQKQNKIQEDIKLTRCLNALKTKFIEKPNIVESKDSCKNVIIKKKEFPVQYNSNNPFQNDTKSTSNKVKNYIQENLVYENPYPSVYVAHEPHFTNVSKQKESSKACLKDMVVARNKKTGKLEIILQNQLSLGSKQTQHNNNEGHDNRADLYQEKVNSIIQDFVDHFANIMNYKWYNDQDILIYGKNGTAMVLLHEAKYMAMKEKILAKERSEPVLHIERQSQHNYNLIKEKNAIEANLKRCQEELKKLKGENDVYETEYWLLKETLHKLEKEMIELKRLKKKLSQTYSEAQLRRMTYDKKNKVQWSDDDIKKALVLNQMISRKAYQFLRIQMKFPLPCLKILDRWMCKRNMNSKSIRTQKKLIDKTSATKRANTLNRETIQTTEATNCANESDIQSQDANYSITETQNEDSNTRNSENDDTEMVDVQNTHTEDVETHQSVEIIPENIQKHRIIVKDEDGRNYLAQPVEADGELYLVYTDGKNVNEEYNVVEDKDVITKNDDNVDGENDVQNDNSDDHITYFDNEDNFQDDDNDDTEIVIDQSVTKYSKWELDAIQKYKKAKLQPEDRSSWNLTCKLCMKPFDSVAKLKKHVPVHYFNTSHTTYLDARKPFVCEFCNEQVPKRHSLVRHHVEHLGIEQFKCWHAGCTYVGRNKSCLSAHMARHLPRRHSCPQCSAAFRKRKGLREHFARRHSARVKRRCALCGAVCRSDYTYYLHKMSHDKPPTFKCPVAGCSESFYSKRALFVHKCAHDGIAAAYQCSLCPLATFTHAFHLNRHMERHEKYQIAQCSKCQKIFDTYSEYYAHIKTAPHTHGKYACVCTESFKTKSMFNEHQKICTLADKNDKTTNLKVTKRNIKKVKKKVNVLEKLRDPSDSIKQSFIKMQDMTVNEKGNDQIPDDMVPQESKHLNQNQKNNTSSEKDCQQIAVPSNLASNPQKTVVNNISQLQNVIPILEKKQGKVFLSQQMFGVTEETSQRQSVAIKRTHEHKKDTVIPSLGGIKKFIREQNNVVVLEEIYQEKVLTINEKDIVVPETRSEQVIPASIGNYSQNVIKDQKVFANTSTNDQVKAITIRDRGIGANIKLEEVTYDNKSQNVISAEKIVQVPETGSQLKIITLAKEDQELAVPTSAAKRVIIISKGKKSNQNITKNEENPRSTLVVQTPEYSQHLNAWQQHQVSKKVLPDTSTQHDIPAIDEV